ncbi:hypothetical protein RLDS_21900 [Sphingobium lactosutens DS20]|uniref:Uncharacterized protein n=1 Tax=Sphingobium lactosutens DS20 TaxID=1331060 RepID=T0H654_9SPHN|nr:hypothetical protein RLDS_21900 [Sphingobium lactosutens DS20]
MDDMSSPYLPRSVSPEQGEDSPDVRSSRLSTWPETAYHHATSETFSCGGSFPAALRNHR